VIDTVRQVDAQITEKWCRLGEGYAINGPVSPGNCSGSQMEGAACGLFVSGGKAYAARSIDCDVALARLQLRGWISG
jgi:hypothetical protein